MYSLNIKITHSSFIRDGTGLRADPAFGPHQGERAPALQEATPRETRFLPGDPKDFSPVPDTLERTTRHPPRLAHPTPRQPFLMLYSLIR